LNFELNLKQPQILESSKAITKFLGSSPPLCTDSSIQIFTNFLNKLQSKQKQPSSNEQWDDNGMDMKDNKHKPFQQRLKQLTELPFFKKIAKKVDFNLLTNKVRKSINNVDNKLMNIDYDFSRTNLQDQEELPTFGQSIKKKGYSTQMS